MQEITPALVGGLLIGLSASLVMLFYGRVTGISNMLQSIVTPNANNTLRSLSFLLGMVLGAFVLSTTHNINPQPTETHPVIIILSGILVGYGTILGSGCTSGHGICGISRLSLRSITATITFMFAGIMTVYLTRHVL